MQFKDITFESREKISTIFSKENSRDCDMSFAASWLWKEAYHVDYMTEGDLMIFRSSYDGVTSFSLPIGEGDKKSMINRLKEYCMEEQIPLRFHSVSRENEAFLEQEYPGEFEIVFDRDDADYIYLAEKLRTLTGKKYHGKRNHINKFMENHEWSYEKITDENRDECLRMLREWEALNCKEGETEKASEILMSEQSVRYMKELGLTGGLIRADGRIVAFAVGEKLTEDTFVVHVEKAYNSVQGAYPMINQQFAIREAGDCMYINREDDCGEEGLRKAKLSYRPVMMQEKGIAEFV